MTINGKQVKIKGSNMKGKAVLITKGKHKGKYHVLGKSNRSARIIKKQYRKQTVFSQEDLEVIVEPTQIAEPEQKVEAEMVESTQTAEPSNDDMVKDIKATLSKFGATVCAPANLAFCSRQLNISQQKLNASHNMSILTWCF